MSGLSLRSCSKKRQSKRKRNEKSRPNGLAQHGRRVYNTFLHDVIICCFSIVMATRSAGGEWHPPDGRVRQGRLPVTPSRPTVEANPSESRRRKSLSNWHTHTLFSFTPWQFCSFFFFSFLFFLLPFLNRRRPTFKLNDWPSSRPSIWRTKLSLKYGHFLSPSITFLTGFSLLALVNSINMEGAHAILPFFLLPLFFFSSRKKLWRVREREKENMCCRWLFKLKTPTKRRSWLL